MVVSWEELGLPVLQALADTDDRNIRDGVVNLGNGSGANGLGLAISDEELHDALLALQDIGYAHIDCIEYASGGFATALGVRVTGRGMQALGQWPSLEVAMTPVTLAAVLERLAEYAPDLSTDKQIAEAVTYIKRSSGATMREAVASFSAEALKIKLGLR
jgi:hypothetical protein